MEPIEPVDGAESVDGAAFRALRPEDVEGAVALNAEAGWNQVAADWRFMLDLGAGFAVEAPGGRLVASGMVLPCAERFAWIAMILVTGQWRRRGLATAIMARAIALCRDRGWVAGLDATEAGRPVYLPLGFRDVYALSRWAAGPDRSVAPAGDVDGRMVEAVAAADLPRLADYDAACNGGRRERLLAHLAGRAPHLAFQAVSGDRLRGFLLARDGRLATQLGPLVAEDEEAARGLLAAGLAAARGPVFLDAGDHHTWLAEQLPRLGFHRQRGYVRMLLGRSEPLDDPSRMVLIAGPEFG